MSDKNLTVTQVTTLADLESLTDADYKDIYNELRGYHSDTGLFDLTLGQFAKLINTQVSRAAWWKYHAGELELGRDMRNELRKAVGQPLLPPTIEEAIEDPNTDVYQIGKGRPNRIVMLDSEIEVWLHSTPTSIAISSSTPSPEPTTASPRPRIRRDRPWVTEDQEAAQRLLGRSWREVIDAGLRTLAVGNQVEIGKLTVPKMRLQDFYDLLDYDWITARVMLDSCRRELREGATDEIAYKDITLFDLQGAALILQCTDSESGVEMEISSVPGSRLLVMFGEYLMWNYQLELPEILRL